MKNHYEFRGGRFMKTRKIRTKMLAFILPVILIAMGLMTFISANRSM